MWQVILILILITVNSYGWGGLVFGVKKTWQANWAVPILGLSIILLIISPLYNLRPNSMPVIPFFTIGLLIGLYRLIWDRNKLLPLLSSQLIAILFIVGLYLMQYGTKAYITGYRVSNDAVMHAIMARVENENIIDKLTGPGMGDLAQYPRATHALVNVVSALAGIESSYLIVVAALFFTTFCVYPAISISSMFIKKSTILQLTASLAAISYYSLAIALHGFLPQAAYVPFVISAAFIDKNKILSFAILMAASVVSYRFVAYLPLLVISIISLILKRQRWKIVLSILIAVIVSTNDAWISFQQLILIISGKSVIMNAVQDYGNLDGFINPGILTGVWFESDYRFVNPDRLLKYLPYLLTIPLLLIGFKGWLKILNKNKETAIQIIGIITCGVIIAVYTKSPYSTSKMMSLAAPLVPILIGIGISGSKLGRNIKAAALVIFGFLLLSSNRFLFRGLSVIPMQIFGEMKEINNVIRDAPTLIQSDNDWLSYYVDKPSVYISNIHYLPD